MVRMPSTAQQPHPNELSGPAWPSNGEIDIIEGVHQSIYNQGVLRQSTTSHFCSSWFPAVSVHTASGCRINSSDSADLHITGDVLSTNCAVGETRNSGCGIRATQSSFGPAFNSMGGGVYASAYETFIRRRLIIKLMELISAMGRCRHRGLVFS
jgi:hypothetical protein